jgi:hypothetical protein
VHFELSNSQIENADHQCHQQSHARTNTFLKVLKVIGIADYRYSPNDFRNKLCETCLAVTKNSQILEIMQWSTTWRGADKPEHHSQFH